MTTRSSSVYVGCIISHVLASRFAFEQTDDVLPFQTSCLGEYALLLAKRPIGLGFGRKDVEKLAKMGMDAAFVKLPA
jgi:hypothetical protein